MAKVKISVPSCVVLGYEMLSDFGPATASIVDALGYSEKKVIYGAGSCDLSPAHCTSAGTYWLPLFVVSLTC